MPSNQLTHYGVPGMKWGKRKAGAYVDKVRSQNAVAREKNVARIQRSGGSKKKAAAKVLGRTAAINVVTNVGLLTVLSVSSNPATRNGARLAARAIGGANTAVAIRDLYQTAKA